MGKGFNSAKNKQAALQEKLEQAKKQKGGGEENDGQAHDEIQRQESSDPQHDEFARLLAQSQPVRSEKVFTQSERRTQQPQAATSHKPKVNAKVLKKRKKMTAASKKHGEVLEEAETTATIIHEGDRARRRDFETLLSLRTSQPLGPMQAAQLVPWVPPFLTHYLIVLADPRRQSANLRQAVQYLTSTLDPDVQSQVMVVSADDNAETAS